MSLCPVVTGARLTEDEVVRLEELTEGSGPDCACGQGRRVQAITIHAPESIVPGSKSTRTALGTYLLPETSLLRRMSLPSPRIKADALVDRDALELKVGGALVAVRGVRIGLHQSARWYARAGSIDAMLLGDDLEGRERYGKRRRTPRPTSQNFAPICEVMSSAVVTKSSESRPGYRTGRSASARSIVSVRCEA